MTNIKEKNIFIIGNGFDLSVGLESTFFDFVKYFFKEKKEKDWNNFIKNCLNTKKDGTVELNEAYLFKFFATDFLSCCEEFDIDCFIEYIENDKSSSSFENNLLLFLFIRKNLLEHCSTFNSNNGRADVNKYFAKINWSNIEDDLEKFLIDKNNLYFFWEVSY